MNTKLKFGDDESIRIRDGRADEKPKPPRKIMLYDIERDEDGKPVAMYWRGVAEAE